MKKVYTLLLLLVLLIGISVFNSYGSSGIEQEAITINASRFNVSSQINSTIRMKNNAGWRLVSMASPDDDRNNSNVYYTLVFEK